MSFNYKNYFNTLLKEAVEPATGSTRPRHETSDDSILPFLDQGTDAESYDTEGMPDELGSVVDKIKQEIEQYANELKSFASKLIDPQNPAAILTKLADKQIATTPEFQEAAEQVAKHLAKAQPAIFSAVTALNTLATLAPGRRDQRKQEDAQVGSGPY